MSPVPRGGRLIRQASLLLAARRRQQLPRPEIVQSEPTRVPSGRNETPGDRPIDAATTD